VMQQSAGIVNGGAPLLEVGDPSALEIVTDVLTADAVRIRPRATATIERWGGAPLAAHVRLVEPSAFTRLSSLGVEEQRVNVVLDLDEPREKWEALGDNYRVESRIVVWLARDAVTVPLGAIFRRGDGWALYAVREGKARVVTVTVGERNDVDAQIMSGLGEGDTVILHPSDAVKDGVRVAQ
jgi:HlyD family secretion protein